MLLLVQLVSVESSLPIPLARVSVNGTAYSRPLRVGSKASFDVSADELNCVVHLEFFCTKRSGLVLPLGTALVDLAGEDLSQPVARSIYSWDGGAFSAPRGTCKLQISCSGTWEPLSELLGLGFEEVLAGQLSSTWARFGGKYSPIVAGIGLDNIHSPYYQQRVRLHGHASPLLPIRYWIRSGTSRVWTPERARACLLYYQNAYVVATRRRPLAAFDAICADVLLFPCRFVRYREDRSPCDDVLEDTYQDPYVPGNDGLADCEDFSKILQLSYFYLLGAADALPTSLSEPLRRIVEWLRLRELLIVQGAVQLPTAQKLTNHVWAALVGRGMLAYMVSPVGTAPPRDPLPTLLLEGTSLRLDGGNDVWSPRETNSAFYAYTMALHVARSDEELGGDYELVRVDASGGVYAMPSPLFFKKDWGQWRALRVGVTTKSQDQAAEAWMRDVEMPRRLPAADDAVEPTLIPLQKPSNASRDRGVLVAREWRLWF